MAYRELDDGSSMLEALRCAARREVANAVLATAGMSVEARLLAEIATELKVARMSQHATEAWGVPDYVDASDERGYRPWFNAMMQRCRETTP